MDNEALFENFDLLFENSVDFKNRLLFLIPSGEQLEDGQKESTLNYESLIKALYSFSFMDRKAPIKIIINSPGGSIYEAFSLVDTIKLIPNEVVGLGVGMISSGASMVLASCDKRYMTEHSYIMAHEGSIELPDITPTDLKIELSHYDQLIEKLAKIYEEASNKSCQYWKEKLSRDFYLDAQNAKKVKLIDDVVTSGNFQKLIMDEGIR